MNIMAEDVMDSALANTQPVRCFCNAVFPKIYNSEGSTKIFSFLFQRTHATFRENRTNDLEKYERHLANSSGQRRLE